MPRKPKPNLSIVAATVTLTVSDGTFGGYASALVSGPIPPHCYVKYACYAPNLADNQAAVPGSGGQVGWAAVDPTTGAALLQLGPTPSWGSGPADGFAWVIWYDFSLPDSTETVISDTVTFHVA